MKSLKTYCMIFHAAVSASHSASRTLLLRLNTPGRALSDTVGHSHEALVSHSGYCNISPRIGVCGACSVAVLQRNEQGAEIRRRATGDSVLPLA
jgi:hypothetical protein